MVTKIFVSQIDSTNSDGTTAANGSYIQLVGGAAVWAAGGGLGATGYGGSIGFIGSLGFQGSKGDQGDVGLAGPMGEEGYKGSAGDAGPGFKGSQGSVGFAGSAGGGVGYTGSAGEIGYQGSISPGGFRGSVGFNGSVGDAGFTGSIGAAGYIGSAGTPGPAISGVPFNYITDLTPNTYPTRANYLVTVNNTANGVTLIDGNTYVRYNSATANINFSGNVFIQGAKLRSYTESYESTATATNSINLTGDNTNIWNITLNPSSGSVVAIRLPIDIPTATHYTVVLYLKQNATGSRTVDWSLNNIKWPTAEGVPATGPTLSTTPNYTDILTFTTMNGGGSWYGFMSGKGFN